MEGMSSPSAYGPPVQTPLGLVSICKTIDEGVFLLRANDTWMLAIHASFVKAQDAACINRIATKHGEYLYFISNTYTVALYNLMIDNLDHLKEYMLSQEALVAYLVQKCREQKAPGAEGNKILNPSI